MFSHFPAYFIGSTAPNNVEDGVSSEVENPQARIENIAGFLCAQENPQILIARPWLQYGAGRLCFCPARRAEVEGLKDGTRRLATILKTTVCKGLKGWC